MPLIGRLRIADGHDSQFRRSAGKERTIRQAHRKTRCGWALRLEKIECRVRSFANSHIASVVGQESESFAVRLGRRTDHRNALANPGHRRANRFVRATNPDHGEIFTAQCNPSSVSRNITCRSKAEVDCSRELKRYG